MYVDLFILRVQSIFKKHTHTHTYQRKKKVIYSIYSYKRKPSNSFELTAIPGWVEMNFEGIRSVTGSWGSRGGGGGGMIAGSPGVGGMSNSSSSSGASWRSGTPSPPLSEEGVPTRSSPCPATSHPSHNQPHYPYNASGSSSSSTPGSTTLDEGIVPDYIEEQHPRKKVSNLFWCSFTSFIDGT